MSLGDNRLRGVRIKHNNESAANIRTFKDMLGHRKYTCRDQLCIYVCYLFFVFSVDLFSL